MKTISKDISIEELIDLVPESTGYLLRYGIKCESSGIPVWGSLDEIARKKGFTTIDIDTFVIELNRLASK